jgi:hypothetical protein
MRLMMLALGTSTLLLGASAPVHVSAATPSTQGASVTAACPVAFLPLLGPIVCSILGL